MLRSKAIITPLTISVLFFICDQFAKYFAFHNQTFSYYLIDPWLGWEYFANPGIAFSIPLPSSLILLLTPLILLGLFVLWGKTKSKTHWLYLGSFLLVAGALSNFIDRMMHAITIDYIRIINSVINIADIMIFVGAVCILVHEHKVNKKHPV